VAPESSLSLAPPSEQPTNQNDGSADVTVAPAASGDTKDEFPYRLEVLYEPKASPKSPVQIVFVHGLNGSKRGTWTYSKESFWPEWLHGERGLKDVRIATFGYNSSTNVLKPNTNLSIPIFANQLLFYLKQLSYKHGSVCTFIELTLMTGIHYFRSP